MPELVFPTAASLLVSVHCTDLKQCLPLSQASSMIYSRMYVDNFPVSDNHEQDIKVQPKPGECCSVNIGSGSDPQEPNATACKVTVRRIKVS